MATCSPRVEITLAGARQACLRRRNAPQPAQASPAAPITHVDGSGTGATVIVRAGEAKPVLRISADVDEAVAKSSGLTPTTCANVWPLPVSTKSRMPPKLKPRTRSKKLSPLIAGKPLPVA